MLKITALTVSHFEQHARILCDTESKISLIVDPGAEADLIFEAWKNTNTAVKGIFLTHSHIDHCGGVAALLTRFKEAGISCPLWGHSAEAIMRSNIRYQSRMFNVPEGYYQNCPEPDHFLSGGETFTLGNLNAEVRFVPGHSPGHLVLFFQSLSHSIDGGTEKSSPILVAGDTLFAGAIGRTDLPGGNTRQLLDSLHSQVMNLPDHTVVLPGHGPSTTIQKERISNPFLISNRR